MKFIKSTMLLLFSVLVLFPLVFVIIGSTHDSSWAFQMRLNLLPGNYFLANYTQVYRVFKIWIGLQNSIYVALVTALLSIIVIYPAAYAFSKFEFRFKKQLYALFVLSVVIPLPAMLIGQVQVIYEIGIAKSLFAFILPFVINVRIFVYLMNISKYIPLEVIEAARIDGENELGIMIKICVPFIKDKLYLSFFLLFVTSWNNFLIPMIISSGTSQNTLPIIISAIADPMRYDVGATLIALLFSIVPICGVFFIFSKHILEDKEVIKRL